MPLNDFVEDHLPVGQHVIVTDSVRQFKGFVSMVTHPERRYPVLSVVTGTAGLGKTVAIQSFLGDQPIRPNTGLPAAVGIKVPPSATAKAVAQEMVRAVDDRPRGRNRNELAEEAADAMKATDLRVLIIDEADRLDDHSFDLVRHVFDKSGCNIVLVGLPQIHSVIDRHDKFRSRVGFRVKFHPLEIDEVLDTVLPQLVFPRWAYHVENEADRSLGERIWQMVRPSLRDLRNLIQNADLICALRGRDSITRDLIDEAFKNNSSEAELRRITELDKRSMDGHYEAESNRRHAAKLRKK